jgi:hypothetical protein
VHLHALHPEPTPQSVRCRPSKSSLASHPQS